MRRRWWVALVVVLLLPVACDSGDGNGAGGGRAGRPTRGGTLRLGVTALPTLDPAQARNVEQVLIADQLFDGLTTYDPKTLQPLPSIAERWSASPDQKQWDFFLREGATFSNGAAIGPPEVKYTFDRIAKKDSGSPATDQLELVTGYSAFAVQATAPDLAGVTVGPAPNQVHFSLDQPQAELPSVLASPLFGIVPRGAVEAPAPAPQFGQAPVTSGPFQFGSRRGDTITLLRSPGSRAYVDRIELVEFDDNAASYRAFTDGRLDWTRVPPDEVARALEKYGRDATEPYTALVFYGFNMKNPKFADVRFREAIVHAIDRRAIVTAVYGDTVLPIDGLLGEGVPGHQDDPCGDKCDRDVELAKELVAEVESEGITPGEVQLDFDEDVTQEAVAKSIQANLQAAGIAAALRPRPLKEHQDFSVSGQQELFRLGWIAAYPSPDAFITPLFETGSRSNLTGFSSPAVDELLRAARSNPDADKRVEQYREAERLIMAQVPIVPIAQFQVQAVRSKRMRGLMPNSFGTFDASRVWLTGGA